MARPSIPVEERKRRKQLYDLEYRRRPGVQARVKEKNRKWRAANKHKYQTQYRFQRMLKSYGITEADYRKLLAEQAGKCQLPSCPNSAECIDHCHVTGRVRGLLCRACNLAIGNFRDDPILMKEGAAYIEQFPRSELWRRP